MRIGAICGECGKYYRGESCPNDHLSTYSGRSMNVINDIPEHFNRGLGETVRGRAEYRALLKQKGLTEVGNEKKYVDPVTLRRVKEREIEKSIEAARPDAYRILDRYEGDTRWN